ncbi:MAG: hypothetical protein H6959_10030 [Chromatiaceae bacterium]|nr:hypothetical protein [Gammaproteobacteria bacterium]MCP5298215.1 hypothetical protein [Chromatiaceae bacterium]MCP5423245.1 hypothetical protein [Chromatiaceae bacterium]
MRKKIINLDHKPDPDPGHAWLDVERLATVEVSSEDDAHPIESALLPGTTSGWRAAQPGRQVIRILFDQPQKLEWIRLRFEEHVMDRTQEFVLRWSGGDGQALREIARQQWNFSPAGATVEVENYRLELAAVTILELEIVPDISGGSALASLGAWRLA